MLRSNVTASATSACDISYTNAIFHVLFSSLIQMVENNCVKGTKKNFEDRTNFLVILVQHGGAQIFLQIWLMMAKWAPGHLLKRSASEINFVNIAGSAPKRLPVNYIAWPRRKTKINKKRLTVSKLLLRLPCVCLWFAPKELVLQKLIDFCYIHTTKSKHKEPKIGLSIKNKSGKRKLSRGDSWS